MTSLTTAEIEGYAIERLFELAIKRARERLTFVERRQLQNTAKRLRDNTDGSRRYGDG